MLVMRTAVLTAFLCVTAVLLCRAETQRRDTASYICDGGMMVHTGFLTGDIDVIGFHASGAPLGIGGLMRYHFARHWRVGMEGYMSSLAQNHNGSFVRYGWGGALLDFYWEFKRVMPYVGFTVGGGANTDLIMMEAPEEEWEPVGESYYRKEGFALVDPYIGIDFLLTRKVHISLKVDCVVPLRKEHDMPIGPRFYVGFLFYH